MDGQSFGETDTETAGRLMRVARTGRQEKKEGPVQVVPFARIPEAEKLAGDLDPIEEVGKVGAKRSILRRDKAALMAHDVPAFIDGAVVAGAGA